MDNYVCDRAIMEELVQYGTLGGYEIGMAETMSQTSECKGNGTCFHTYNP